MTIHQQAAVWRNHASQWQKVGPPLRPSTQDGALMMAAVAPNLRDRREGAKVVVLGVTQELVQLAWPNHVSLHAFDHSAEMIAAVWQPHPVVPGTVRQARWEDLPLPNRSVKVAIGDGSLNALPRLAEYPAVLVELARVLEPEGVLCLRCFVRPPVPETQPTVSAAALSGEIRSFHALKWRVAMTLSEAPEFSVAVSDIHAAFESMFPDREVLAAAAGWPLEIIDSIDAYKGAQTRYTFPSLIALAEICSPHFALAEVRCGDYELADRCPTVSFKLSDRRTDCGA